MEGQDDVRPFFYLQNTLVSFHGIDHDPGKNHRMASHGMGLFRMKILLDGAKSTDDSPSTFCLNRHGLTSSTMTRGEDELNSLP